MLMVRLCRAVEHGIAWIGAVVAWATLIPLIAVSVYDIVGRQFFNTGSTRLQELEWHFFLALVMLCLGSAYLADAHVRIDLLRDHLTVRTRAWIELLGCLLVLVPFCLLLIIHGGDIALGAFATDERSRAPLGLPHRWIIMSALPVGGFLLLLAGLSIMAHNGLLLVGHGLHAAPEAGRPPDDGRRG